MKGGDDGKRESPPRGFQADALERVRSAIILGELPPGSRLIETELAEEFETNRTYIRSILLVLESEGLILRDRHHGARVRRVSLRTALEVTQVRGVIEGFCAAQAALRMSTDRKAVLRRICTDMQEAVARDNFLEYSNLNHRLHGTIQDYAENEIAKELLEKLRGRSGVSHQFHLAFQPGRAAVSLQEHLDIAKAVMKSDPEAAEASMRAHLLSVMKALETFYTTESLASLGLPMGPNSAAPLHTSPSKGR